MPAARWHQLRMLGRQDELLQEVGGWFAGLCPPSRASAGKDPAEDSASQPAAGPGDAEALNSTMLWIEMHPRADVLALAKGADVVLWKGGILHTAVHDGPVVHARWSPDGARLAVCEVRGRVAIYDRDLRRIGTFEAGH